MYYLQRLPRTHRSINFTCSPPDEQKPRRRRITRQSEQVSNETQGVVPSESGYTSSPVEGD